MVEYPAGLEDRFWSVAPSKPQTVRKPTNTNTARRKCGAGNVGTEFQHLPAPAPTPQAFRFRFPLGRLE